MSGSSLDLLLRVAGGGKRGRATGASVTKDEKLHMAIHQMDLMLAKVPAATDQMILSIVEKVKAYTANVKSHQDTTLLQATIAALPSSILDEFKKVLDEKKINDQTFAHYLVGYFIPEARAMSEMIEVLSILIEVFEKAFAVQCVSSLWTEQGGGYFTFKELKTLIEARTSELMFMRKHGLMAD